MFAWTLVFCTSYVFACLLASPGENQPGLALLFQTFFFTSVSMPGLVLLPAGDSSSSSSRSAPITECFRQLAGHSGRVTNLSWSPHQSELLLSSSYDGTAQVKHRPYAKMAANLKYLLYVFN